METERKGIILFSSLLWGQHHLPCLTSGRQGRPGLVSWCHGSHPGADEVLFSEDSVGILDANTPDLHALAGHSGRCVLYGYSSHNAG